MLLVLLEPSRTFRKLPAGMRLNSRLVEEECGRRSDMAGIDAWEDARGPTQFTEMTRGSVCGMLAGAAVDARTGGLRGGSENLYAGKIAAGKAFSQHLLLGKHFPSAFSLQKLQILTLPPLGLRVRSVERTRGSCSLLLRTDRSPLCMLHMKPLRRSAPRCLESTVGRPHSSSLEELG